MKRLSRLTALLLALLSSAAFAGDVPEVLPDHDGKPGDAT